MSFSEEMAKVVADPLARFVTFKSPAGAGSYKVADPDVANESSRVEGFRHRWVHTHRAELRGCERIDSR